MKVAELQRPSLPSRTILINLISNVVRQLLSTPIPSRRQQTYLQRLTSTVYTPGIVNIINQVTQILKAPNVISLIMEQLSSNGFYVFSSRKFNQLIKRYLNGLIQSMKSTLLNQRRSQGYQQRFHQNYKVQVSMRQAQFTPWMFPQIPISDQQYQRIRNQAIFQQQMPNQRQRHIIQPTQPLKQQRKFKRIIAPIKYMTQNKVFQDQKDLSKKYTIQRFVGSQNLPPQQPFDMEINRRQGQFLPVQNRQLRNTLLQNQFANATNIILQIPNQPINPIYRPSSIFRQIRYSDPYQVTQLPFFDDTVMVYDFLRSLIVYQYRNHWQRLNNFVQRLDFRDGNLMRNWDVSLILPIDAFSLSLDRQNRYPQPRRNLLYGRLSQQINCVQRLTAANANQWGYDFRRLYTLGRLTRQIWNLDFHNNIDQIRIQEPRQIQQPQFFFQDNSFNFIQRQIHQPRSSGQRQRGDILQFPFEQILRKMCIGLAYRIYQQHCLCLLITSQASSQMFQQVTVTLARMTLTRRTQIYFVFQSTIFQSVLQIMNRIGVTRTVQQTPIQVPAFRIINLPVGFDPQQYTPQQYSIMVYAQMIFNVISFQFRRKMQMIKRKYQGFFKSKMIEQDKQFYVQQMSLAFRTAISDRSILPSTRMGSDMFTIPVNPSLVLHYLALRNLFLTNPLLQNQWNQWFVYTKSNKKGPVSYGHTHKPFIQFCQKQWRQQKQWYHTCWGLILLYLITQKYGQQNKMQWIQYYRAIGQYFTFGLFQKAVKKLCQIFDVGFLIEIEEQNSIIKEGKLHIQLVGTHMTLVNWDSVVKRSKFISTKNYQNQTLSLKKVVFKKIGKDHQQRHMEYTKGVVSYTDADKQFRNIFRAQNPGYRGQIPTYIKYDDHRQLYFRRHVMYLDIQCCATLGYTQKCYMACLVGYGDYPIQQFKQCITSFNNPYKVPTQIVLYLKAYMNTFKVTQQDPLILWYFNGNKYQMSFILQDIVKIFGQCVSWGNPSQSKGYSVDNGRLLIRDAILLHTPSSLAQLTKSYCINYVKDKDMNIGLIKTMQEAQKEKEKIKAYCFLDCLSLMELVQRTYIHLQDLSIQMARFTNTKQLSLTNLYQMFTAASLAMFMMVHHFFQKDIVDNQPQYWKKIQRKFYKGGITQIFKHMFQQQSVSIDINSSYPFAMTFDLPWKFVRQFKNYQIKLFNQNKQLIQPLNFYQLDYFNFKGTFPTIPIQSQQGLIYPNSYKDTTTSIYVWGCVLIQTPKQFQYHIKSGCQYTCYDQQGVKLDYAGRYASFLYKKKQNTDKKKQTGKYNTVKVMMNSPYGKWAQARYSNFKLFQKGFPFNSEKDQVYYFSQTQWGVLRQQKSIKKPYIGDFVRIASFITAKARSHLGRLGNVVGIQNLLYCDTDSLTIKKKCLENIKQYLHQTQLGKWKVESHYLKVLYIAPKCGILFERKEKQGVQTLIWKYKWKGVPLKMLQQRQQAPKLYQQMKAQLQSIMNHPYAKVFLAQFTLDRILVSQRWQRLRNGIRICHYFRTTNIKIKKKIDKFGNAISFDL